MEILTDTWYGVLGQITLGVAILTWLASRLWGWLGRTLLRSPLNQRRWTNFRSNKRAWWSLAIFSALFGASLFAEVIAHEKPMLIFKGCEFTPLPTNDGCEILTPQSKVYDEGDLGGLPGLNVEDYYDPYVQDLITDGDMTMVSPLHHFYHDTINRDVASFPAPPTAENPLGLDDNGRDVLSRLIYGFRISVQFGLTLTFFVTIIGVLAGAAQGYFGGWLDLIFQRVIEIWGSIPMLFTVMIVAAIIKPTFWLLLWVLLAFGWTQLVGVVRAEFLRARNFEYVQAARALGVGNWTIILRHVLPNAMVATLTMLPFVLTGAIGSLASLDYLGLGLQASGPSLGDLARQGKDNTTNAPWLGLTAFFSLGFLLSLLVFIFEGVRDALDPRKVFK